MKRTGPPQRRAPLKRTRRRKSKTELEYARAFKLAVCAKGRCFFCEEERTLEQLDAAHIIPAQVLRAHTSTLDPGARARVVYDPRLAVPACTARPIGVGLNNCHSKWDLLGKPQLTLGDLPARAIDAAEEHGLMHLLERRYGEFRV